VFKQGLLDEKGMIHFEPSGRFIREGSLTQQKLDNKIAFEQSLSQMVLPQGIHTNSLNQLHDQFSYKEIELALKNTLLAIEQISEKKKIRYDILSMVNTSYELHFPSGSLLSERVIFPVTRSKKME
jgi:hypothetical protein